MWYNTWVSNYPYLNEEADTKRVRLFLYITMPKTTKKAVKKATKPKVKKLGSVKKINAGYFLEVSVNDEVYRGDADSLEQALHDFVVSSSFPFAVKTRVVVRYGTENAERQRTLHVPAARRLFATISTKPSSLELLAAQFTSNLAS